MNYSKDYLFIFHIHLVFDMMSMLLNNNVGRNLGEKSSNTMINVCNKTWRFKCGWKRNFL